MDTTETRRFKRPILAWKGDGYFEIPGGYSEDCIQWSVLEMDAQRVHSVCYEYRVQHWHTQNQYQQHYQYQDHEHLNWPNLATQLNTSLQRTKSIDT